MALGRFPLARLHACAFRDYSLGFSSTGPFENIENLSQVSGGNFAGAGFFFWVDFFTFG